MMNAAVFISILFSALVFAVGPALGGDAGLAKLFEARRVQGCMVIVSLDGKTEYVHNRERALQGLLPASTFKIPNTLIALEEGAVPHERDIIKWDGRDRGWAPWNRDHSLETAFPASCVWFYQALARRVGQAAYLSHLGRLDYGNGRTGPDVETFWLEGDLKISAFGQIRFLKTLYHEDLPYKKDHIGVLKRLMVVEETPVYTIRAKTGWATRLKTPHGWYVGYVENREAVWFFAMNMDIEQKEKARFRKPITMDALRQKGIIQ